ncbi:MAG: nucleotidyltransferase domain-containing protein [Gammaproteobacteria bacterium]|nr:nucleotidyltransferase domain-containing protein [Gammaproteobacteria bacterium]
MLLNEFLADTSSWAKERTEVVALVLVGSHARGTARPDSDVDLIVLCTNPVVLLHDRDWVAGFGKVQRMGTEDYGPMQSLRVFYENGLEVEFGIAGPAWARVPLDPGTRRILSDGRRILYDQKGLLTEALNATAASSAAELRR